MVEGRLEQPDRRALRDQRAEGPDGSQDGPKERESEGQQDHQQRRVPEQRQEADARAAGHRAPASGAARLAQAERAEFSQLREHDDQRHVDQRIGRGQPHLEVLEALQIDVEAEHRRRAGRTPVGHDEDGVDRNAGNRSCGSAAPTEQDRLDRGQRHHTTGSATRSRRRASPNPGFPGRDRLEAGKADQEHQRRPLPDVGGDHGGPAPASGRSARPVGRGPKPADQVVDHAELGVEQPAPDQTRPRPTT